MFSVANCPVLLNNHCPATIPIANASHPTNLITELGLCIAHEVDFSIRLRPVDPSPTRHDERVIRSNHDNKIDTLGNQLIDVVKVGWDAEGSQD